MKTRIRYVDITTQEGANIANLLVIQGWRIASNTPYGIKFYKIYLK
jgi:hypothetical protein